MVYFNSDTHLKIELPIEQLDIMHNLCDESNPYETGGILFGSYSDDNFTAHISEITNSPDDSVKKRSRFKRGTDGLQIKLDTLWKDNQYYLGEWHYHPNSSPTPSRSDIEQMVSFSHDKKLNCPEPILIILGGNKDNWMLNVMVIANGKTISFHEMR